MEVLCSLFDTVAGVGELLGRSEEKCQELTKLVSTVGTLSQSVRSFVEDLPPDEKEQAFRSNQVFAQLVSQMQECSSIISKHRTPTSQAIGDNEPGERRKSIGDATRSALRAGWQRGSRTLHEGMEVLSGKLGSLGSGLFQLPEDELAIIRQASQELERLVPLLTLAVQVFNQRGQKRPISQNSMQPCQMPRLRSNVEVPELHLQLVSEHPSARNSTQLPVLTTRALRLRTGSSSSLDGDVDVFRLAFGRQELKDKVPRSITLTAKSSEAPQPLARFVSRDMFNLEVPVPQPEQVQDQDDDMGATLQLGAGDAGNDDFATLVMGDGGGDQSVSLKPLAVVVGLTQSGLHLRAFGEKRWRWMAKEKKADVQEGDCIAVLLESPPGSSNPGPPRDLEEQETTCLLGIELHASMPS